MNVPKNYGQLLLALKTRMGKATIAFFLLVVGGVFLQNYWYQGYAEKMELIYQEQKSIANRINENVHLLNLLQNLMMPPNDVLIHAAKRVRKDNGGLDGKLFQEFYLEKENLKVARESLEAFLIREKNVENARFFDELKKRLDAELIGADSIFAAAARYWETGEHSQYQAGAQLMEEVDTKINDLILEVKRDSEGLILAYQKANAFEATERDGNNENRRMILLVVSCLTLLVGVVYLTRVGKHEALKQVLEDRNKKLTEAYDDTEVLIQELMDKNKLLEELSIKDGLTGLYNRRHFVHLLEQEKYRADRYEEASLCLLMIDIDHFKRINDTYGHLVGDEVIKAVAGFLQKGERMSDVAGRYGGEEFVVFLPSTDLKGAMIKAERLRKDVEEHTILLNEESISLTISIGISFYKKGMTIEALTGEADVALYEAKNAGRNTVRMFKG